MHKTFQISKKVTSALDVRYKMLDWKNAIALRSSLSTSDNGIAHLCDGLKVIEMGESHISNGKVKAEI